MNKKSCPHSNMQICGNVTVGSKGQIVIPKEAREKLGISFGDNLVVLTKGDIALGLIKAENIKDIIQYIQSEIGE